MFDTKAHATLGCYVYLLFDPRRPNIPFYIGKGRGNRIFAHASGEGFAVDDEEPIGPKLQLIADIRSAGFDVLHKVIRFGLSEDEAFKIEAALIDMVNHIQPDTLTNQVSGHGVAEGIYDALDLAASLGAQELHSELSLLVIKIERQWTILVDRYGSGSRIPVDEIYLATKGDWKVSIARAAKAECVLAVARGLVRAVFVPAGWTDTGENSRKRMTGRADASQYQGLVGCSVAHFFERGSQNPVRYLRC